MTDPRVAPAAARFGDVAADYERGRPTDPGAVLDALVAVAGVGPGAAVVDVAAGTTTVEEATLDSASRSYVITLDSGARRRVLDEVAAFLADHPDVAGRSELTYERPCSLHLCQRMP